MTPLPPVPGVVRIEQLWKIGGDLNAATILHWAYTGTPPTDATAAALATTIYGALATVYPPVLSDVVIYANTRVTDLSTESGGQGETTTGGTTGTRTGGPLPAGACAVASYHILRRYRGGKPRSYYPFGTETDLSSSLTWSSGSITNFETALADVTAGITGASSGGCVLTNQVSVSYYTGNEVVINPITMRARNVPQKRTVPLVDTVVSSLIAPNLGSQRRRNRAA